MLRSNLVPVFKSWTGTTSTRSRRELTLGQHVTCLVLAMTMQMYCWIMRLLVFELFWMGLAACALAS